jgi:hypothetical protein
MSQVQMTNRITDGQPTRSAQTMAYSGTKKAKQSAMTHNQTRSIHGVVKRMPPTMAQPKRFGQGGW